MVAVAAYLLYTFAFTGNGDQGPAARAAAAVSVSEANAMVVETTARIQASMPTASESYLVTRAQEPWDTDPFYTPPEIEKRDVPLSLEEGLAFLYTGYMNIAGTPFAVVNGQEYTVGQFIGETEYKLSKIAPEWIEIRDVEDTGTLRIPYEEEWPGS